VKQRFLLYTLGIAFLLTMTGCGAMILEYHDFAGLDNPPALPLGVSRQEVEKEIGKPISSRALPDGGRLDTYEYVARNPEWQKEAITSGMFSAATLGLLEPLLIPMANRMVEQNRRTVTFTYGPYDRLLDHRPPPFYGPVDDALGRLSWRDIRERCGSEHLIEGREMKGDDVKHVFPSPGFAYRQCILLRFAIWGIE